jgi:hypothetical protein
LNDESNRIVISKTATKLSDDALRTYSTVRRFKYINLEILNIQSRFISSEGTRHVWLLNSGKTQSVIQILNWNVPVSNARRIVPTVQYC